MIGDRIDYDTYLEHDQFGNAPHLLSGQDRDRINVGDWKRVAGGALCVCGETANNHYPLTGARWLTRLCNNTLVKL